MHPRRIVSLVASLLAAVVVLAGAPAAAAAPTSNASDTALGRRLVDRFMTMLEHKDVAGLRALLAPEFQIVNESTTSQWLNAIEGWVGFGLWVVWPHRTGYPFPYEGPYPQDGFDLSPDYRAELALAHDPVALLKRLNLLLAAGQLSAATQQRIADALLERPVAAHSSEEDKRWRVVAAIVLVMSCPEYLVQK